MIGSTVSFRYEADMALESVAWLAGIVSTFGCPKHIPWRRWWYKISGAVRGALFSEQELGELLPRKWSSRQGRASESLRGVLSAVRCVSPGDALLPGPGQPAARNAA